MSTALVEQAAAAPWLASARQAIAASVAAGRLPHALLITGVAGLGKTALAEWIARYALCDRPAEDACGHCPSCEFYRAGSHPDLVRVGIEEDRKQILVDSIRELIAGFALKSYRGRRKVALVTPADALNTNGANALLKTLEEPSGEGLLILVAARPEKLPATIASRCQRIKIAAPPHEQALQWLASQREDVDWSLPLALASGAPLAALALGALPELADEMAEVAARLGRGDVDIPQFAERCQKDHPAERLRCLEHWLSERIRHGLTAPAAAGAGALTATARRRHIQSLYDLLDEVRRARFLLGTNAAVALVFEQLFVTIAREFAALRSAPRQA